MGHQEPIPTHMLTGTLILIPMAKPAVMIMNTKTAMAPTAIDTSRSMIRQIVDVGQALLASILPRALPAF